MNQGVHHGGNEAFALGLLSVFFQEVNETVFRQFDKGGGEEPEIHGHQFFRIHRQAFALQVIAAHHSVFIGLNLH